MTKKQRNIEELLEEPVYGDFSSDEIRYVVQKIKDSKPGQDSDLFKCLIILGRAAVDEHRKLVEKYLYYPSQPWVSREALHTLCAYWHLNQDYLKEIKMFIRGVEWDIDEDVRLMALSSAGALLRETIDKELLQLLLEVFEHLGNTNEIRETDASSRALIKGSAYKALARAMGRDWTDIQDSDEIIDLIEMNALDSLDQDVIEKNKEMLKSIKIQIGFLTKNLHFVNFIS